MADVPILRRGMAELLAHAGFDVRAESSSAADALKMASESAPDIIVADACLSGVTGVLLTGVLRRAQPRIKVMLLVDDHNDAVMIAAACAGARAVVTRDATAQALAETITRVANGERPILQIVADRIAHIASMPLVSDALQQRDTLQTTGKPLSAGELVALDCVARGLTVSEAAAYLGLAPGTVKNRIQRLRVRHGLHSQTQLIHFASQHGWIMPAAVHWASGT